ncbi:phosphatase PAP2 family protein [Mollicutes bacterium LVI A0039]|nr:phosphatase PAP2 family protein [Mollicutes bacterium LVI A0039]
MKKIYLWFIPIIILIMIGTIYDWQISTWQATVNTNLLIHGFYRFFEIFGGAFLGIVVSINFGFFANFKLRHKEYLKALISILLMSVANILTFVSFASFLNPENGNSGGTVSPLGYLLCIIFGIITTWVIIKLFNKIQDQDYAKYRQIAIAGITYLIVLALVINSMKYIWARPRFWVVTSGDAIFTPWYIINGNHVDSVTNAYKSFPSGHTAYAFCSIALSLWFGKYQSQAFGFFMTWGLLTAISRIFAGQHYLTDTVIAGLISITIYIIVMKSFKIDIDS